MFAVRHSYLSFIHQFQVSHIYETHRVIKYWFVYEFVWVVRVSSQKIRGEEEDNLWVGKTNDWVYVSPLTHTYTNICTHASYREIYVLFICMLHTYLMFGIESALQNQTWSIIKMDLSWSSETWKPQNNIRIQNMAFTIEHLENKDLLCCSIAMLFALRCVRVHIYGSKARGTSKCAVYCIPVCRSEILSIFLQIRLCIYVYMCVCLLLFVSHSFCMC